MLRIVKDRPTPKWGGPFINGIQYVEPLPDGSIPLVKAVPLCTTHRRWAFYRLIEQIQAWEQVARPSFGWVDYCRQLEYRAAKLGETGIAAWKYIQERACTVGHMCHGDLTLENVLVNVHDIFLIDPNPDRYGTSSVWLDIGKIAFSLEYHRRFDSYWMTSTMELLVKEYLGTLPRSLWHRAMVSHIIRLEGHQPYDRIVPWLEKELRCVYS